MELKNENDEEESLLSQQDNHDGGNINKINTVIEKLGIGRFSYWLISRLSTVYFTYGAEMTMLGIIAPFFKCEWNLTGFELGFMTSTNLIGQGVGFVFWGWMGDKFGRKPVLLTSLFIAMLFSFLTVFSTGYLLFALFRGIVGIGIASFLFPACLLSEYLPTRIRGIGILASMISYSLGSIFVAWIAKIFLLQNKWRLFFIVVSAPIVIALAASITLPESIRFLANKSKIDKLRTILQHIAKAHHKELSNEDIDNIRPLQGQQTDENFRMIFRKDRLPKLLAVIVTLSACLLNFYGFIIWNTDLQQRYFSPPQNETSTKCHKLTPADYNQNMIVAVSGLLGTSSSLILVDLIGRKKPVIISLLAVSLLILSLNFRMSFITFSSIMFLGRGIISTGLATTNLILNEVFETSVRAKVGGFAQMIGCCITGLAPFLIQYGSHYSMMAVTVGISVFCVIGAVACMTLKETKGRPLDEKE